MPYEDGMSVQYNELSKTLVVQFRGEKVERCQSF